MTAVDSGEKKPAIVPRLLMACSTVADGSGMMAAVAPLASEMGRRGFDVRLVGPIGPSERPVAADPEQGVRVDVLLRKPFSLPPLAEAWNTAAAVADFARAGGSCVLHVHGVWTAANAAACLRSQMLGVPYVVSPHGMLLPAAMHRSRLKKRWALRSFVRRNLEAAALVHASSEAERESVLAVAPAARTCVIPWGVDVPDAPRARRSTEAKRLAAYIGRIIPLKGVDELVAAWAAVRPDGWELRFVGPDPENHVERLVEVIKAQGLRETVSVHAGIGRDDLMRLVQKLDLLVLPSHSENFGMVVAEALAASVPVITTAATPWQDVAKRQCGWWVPDTITGLATAIHEACELPGEDLSSMGARGRAWMRESYAWPTLAARFAAELYQVGS